MPEGASHYEFALTTLYHESKEIRDKISLVPIPNYSSFPLNGKGPHFDRLRIDMNFCTKKYITNWKPDDWAMGVPHTINDEDTYKIFNEYSEGLI